MMVASFPCAPPLAPTPCPSLLIVVDEIAGKGLTAGVTAGWTAGLTARWAMPSSLSAASTTGHPVASPLEDSSTSPRVLRGAALLGAPAGCADAPVATAAGATAAASTAFASAAAPTPDCRGTVATGAAAGAASTGAVDAPAIPALVASRAVSSAGALPRADCSLARAWASRKARISFTSSVGRTYASSGSSKRGTGTPRKAVCTWASASTREAPSIAHRCPSNALPLRRAAALAALSLNGISNVTARQSKRMPTWFPPTAGLALPGRSGSYLRREAIRRHQRSSEVIRGHRGARTQTELACQGWRARTRPRRRHAARAAAGPS